VYYDAGVGTGDITKVEANRQGMIYFLQLHQLVPNYNRLAGPRSSRECT
jgi:hypothetical protein